MPKKAKQTRGNFGSSNEVVTVNELELNFEKWYEQNGERIKRQMVVASEGKDDKLLNGIIKNFLLGAYIEGSEYILLKVQK